MRSRIDVDEEWSRIEVIFTGPVTFEDRIDVIDIIRPMLVERDFTRILLDYSHAWVGNPSTEALEQLNARIRSEPHLKRCWVALVNPPDFHAIPTEDIGAEIGFPVRRFYNRRAAVEWLNSCLP